MINYLLESELSVLIVYDNEALYRLSISHFPQKYKSSFHLVSSYSEVRYPLSLCSVYIHEGLTIDPSLFNYIHQYGVRIVSSCLHFLDGLIKPPSEFNCFDGILLTSSKLSDYHEDIVRKTFSGSSLYSELKSLEYCRKKSTYVGSPIFDNAHLSRTIDIKSPSSCLFFPQTENATIGKISTLCQLSSKPYLFKLFASLSTLNFGLLTRINSQYSIIYNLFLQLASDEITLSVKSRDKHRNDLLVQKCKKAGIKVEPDLNYDLDINYLFSRLISQYNFAICTRSFSAIESIFNGTRSYMVDISILDTFDRLNCSPFFYNYVSLMRSPNHPIWSFPGVIELIRPTTQFKLFMEPLDFKKYALNAWGLDFPRKTSYELITLQLYSLF